MRQDLCIIFYCYFYSSLTRFRRWVHANHPGDRNSWLNILRFRHALTLTKPELNPRHIVNPRGRTFIHCVLSNNACRTRCLSAWNCEPSTETFRICNLSWHQVFESTVDSCLRVCVKSATGLIDIARHHRFMFKALTIHPILFTSTAMSTSEHEKEMYPVTRRMAGTKCSRA